jgi:hypothetical protein
MCFVVFADLRTLSDDPKFHILSFLGRHKTFSREHGVLAGWRRCDHRDDVASSCITCLLCRVSWTWRSACKERLRFCVPMFEVADAIEYRTVNLATDEMPTNRIRAR